MPKLQSLRQLFVEELRHLYALENQLIDLLPAVASAADSVPLTLACNDRLADSKKHADRLEQIMDGLDVPLLGRTRPASVCLLSEIRERTAPGFDATIRDAALLAKLSRVAHHEIAGYRCARALARQAGCDETVDLLQNTLEEELIAEEILRGISRQLMLEPTGMSAGRER